eukprot:gene47576-38657_t
MVITHVGGRPVHSAGDFAWLTTQPPAATSFIQFLPPAAAPRRWLTRARAEVRVRLAPKAAAPAAAGDPDGV